MDDLGIRQFAFLLLGTSKIAIGYLGLAGSITDHSLIIGAMHVVMVILAFDLGRQSTQVDRI